MEEEQIFKVVRKMKSQYAFTQECNDLIEKLCLDFFKVKAMPVTIKVSENIEVVFILQNIRIVELRIRAAKCVADTLESNKERRNRNILPS